MLRRLFYGLLIALIAILWIFHPSSSHAQSGLDPTRSALQGSISLAVGFAPNPHIVQLPFGGDINADRYFAARELSACQGYTTAAPTLQLNWSGTTGQLRFEFAADNDSALIILGPDGEWRCNDDQGRGQEPRVEANNPPAGTYLIWIASLERDVEGVGTLSIWGSPTSSAVDLAADPLYGTYAITEGTTTFPFSLDLTSGGSVNIDRDCVGYATSAPALVLDVRGDFNVLTLDFEANGDNVMMVYSPAEEWLCDDDSGDGRNPRLTLQNADEGQYWVWIATYSRGERNPGTFFVRDTMPASTDNASETGEPIDIEAPPIYGSAELEAGFSPDPFTVRLTSGGGANLSQVGADTNCYGYSTSAPSFILAWTGVADQLRLDFRSGGDTTLVVYTPNDEWVCNDDRPNSLDPLVAIADPAAGSYRIWVASYNTNNRFEGTLSISATGEASSDGGTAFQLPTTTLPTYGTATLVGGSDADPIAVTMAAGGNIRADAAVPSDDAACRGFLSPAPNYALRWTGNGNALSVSFASDTETVLIVMDESGAWACQAGGSPDDPNTLLLNNPADGTYLIWVGTVRSGVAARGTLTLTWAEAITPPDNTPGEPQDDASSSRLPESDLDVDAAPEFGTDQLAAGFSPDIYTVDITSGGSVSIVDTLAMACRGFTDAAPDFAFDWSGDALRLELDFVSLGDTVLVVYTPSGAWRCDDDSGPGLSPELVIATPEAGTYLVWVATFDADQRVDGTLELSELGD